MKKEKRGQISIFIILGIIILVVISLAIAFFSPKIKNLSQTEQTPAEEAEPVRLYVENCLQNSLIEGIHKTFSQGGYFEYPANLALLEKNSIKIPYYFISQDYFFPALETIEEETSNAAEYYFNGCIGNFAQFQSMGYKIQSSSPQIKIDFEEKNIIANLNFPLEIQSNEKTVSINNFLSQIQFGFPKHYNLIKEYLIKQKEEPESFLIGTIANFSVNNNFIFSFEQGGQMGKSVAVDFNYGKILKKEPLIFSFALDYNWNEIGYEGIITEPEPEVRLKEEPSWNINSNGILTHKIEAEGRGLRFYTDSEDFTINSDTGIITLDSTRLNNGNYIYYVKITDDFDESYITPFYVNVNK